MIGLFFYERCYRFMSSYSITCYWNLQNKDMRKLKRILKRPKKRERESRSETVEKLDRAEVSPTAVLDHEKAP